jgi:exonuclease VII large subunit
MQNKQTNNKQTNKQTINKQTNNKQTNKQTINKQTNNKQTNKQTINKQTNNKQTNKQTNNKQANFNQTKSILNHVFTNLFGNKKGENSTFLLTCLIITSLLIGFITGLMIQLGNQPNGCTYAIQEKIIEKQVNVTDLDFCLEHVKESDLFQRELYKKGWLNDGNTD